MAIVTEADMLEQVGVRLLKLPQGAYDPRRVQEVIRAYHGPRSVETLSDYDWATALERSLTWELLADAVDDSGVSL